VKKKRMAWIAGGASVLLALVMVAFPADPLKEGWSRLD
jgi:hypothetical protein